MLNNLYASVSFEPLLDSESAAAIIQVHPKTLQRYARNGIIRGVRVGKLWRFRISDLLPGSSDKNPPVRNPLDEEHRAL